ncbi:MAG TPA: hypothetical protein VF625_12900 [Longimicrobium sp.]|jgi:hypothetical protein
MRSLLLGIAAVLALAGCQRDVGGSEFPEPSGATNTIEGTVIAGRGIVTEIAGATVSLYASRADFDAGRRLPQRATLAGTLPRYTFTVGGLKPGQYYIQICSPRAGCVYPGTRTPPIPETVTEGVVSRVTITLDVADFPA